METSKSKEPNFNESDDVVVEITKAINNSDNVGVPSDVDASVEVVRITPEDFAHKLAEPYENEMPDDFDVFSAAMNMHEWTKRRAMAMVSELIQKHLQGKRIDWNDEYVWCVGKFVEKITNELNKKL